MKQLLEGIGLPTVPKRKRSREVVGLAAASPLIRPPVLGQPTLQQAHALIPASFVIGPKPFGSTPDEVAFEKWLTGLISGSLNQRTKSRDELVSVGTSKFKLSKRRANAIRDHVVIERGASAWSAAGAPRGKRKQT